MKKHLMVMLLAAAAQNINAQLVVDEDGKVGIGTESPQALLQIDKSTAKGYIGWEKLMDYMKE